MLQMLWTMCIGGVARLGRGEWQPRTTIYPSTKPRRPRVNQSRDVIRLRVCQARTNSNLGLSERDYSKRGTCISEAWYILWKPLKPKQAFAQIWSHQLHVPQGRREVQVHPSNKWNQPPQALIFSASNSSICVDASPQHTKPRCRDSLTTQASKSSLLRLTPTSS